MPSDFLSQEEVDALLKGVGGEAESREIPEEAEAAGGIRPWNPGAPERIVTGRMPTLDLINERFARHLRSGLFNYMHRTAEVSAGSIRAQKYSEFVRNLVTPSAVNLATATPLRGTSLFIFEPNLVFLIVDNMFGGDGRFPARIEGRDFTGTELRIVQGLLKVVFAEYARAWKPIYDLAFEYIRSEMNLQFANIAAPSDIVISTTFSIEIGGTASDMHICFPYAMVEPIRDRLSGAVHGAPLVADQRWTLMLRNHLKDAEVEIAAELATATLTLGQILRMKADDIIPVDIPERIIARVDDVPLMECRYGQQGGQYALKIERFVSMGGDEESSPGAGND